jgi:hypothetical protein
LKQIESLSWTGTFNPSLIRGSPNQELSFLALFFNSEPIDFPSKTGAM